MSDNIELINASDLKQLVQDATYGFTPEALNIISAHLSELPFIINLINVVQMSVEGAISQEEQYQRGQGQLFYSAIATNQIDYSKMYVQLTQIFYLLRTFFTGETIDFIENIDGDLKIIKQKDWLSLLSGSTIFNKKEYYGGIYLQESILQQNIQKLISINQSEAFSQQLDYQAIVNDMIEAASMPKDQRKKTTIKHKSHWLYQKTARDTWVYAYYSGKYRHINYLYQKKIAYNLGHIQEEVLNKLERYDELSSKIGQPFINLLNGEHPIGYILAGWTANTVPGLVEGDIKTKTGQWFQSKRHNEKVISLLQIHNGIINIKTKLLAIQNMGRTPINLDELAEEFYHMFSSDKEIINHKLYNKIRLQLGTLAGQSVL